MRGPIVLHPCLRAWSADFSVFDEAFGLVVGVLCEPARATERRIVSNIR